MIKISSNFCLHLAGGSWCGTASGITGSGKLKSFYN